MSEIAEQPKTLSDESIEGYSNCLLIDNEMPLIIRLNKSMEKAGNFEAVHCTTIEKALEIIRNRNARKPLDILFLDHSLTDRGSEGLEIAKIVKQEFPHIRIISTTGDLSNLHDYLQAGIKVDHIEIKPPTKDRVIAMKNIVVTS